MIYVDNAATSFPKPQKVYSEMLDCLENYCANPGRGSHQMSIKCSKAIFEARESLAKFFNTPDPKSDMMRICFTKNATEALNLVIHGIVEEGDHVITSCMEHNAVMRPLRHLERDNGIRLTLVNSNEYGEIYIEDVKKEITKNTKMMIFTFSSNVNGIVMPIADLGKIAAESGIIFVVDAAQGAGSFPIDVTNMNIDILTFPGHKSLLGPQGTGGLYARPHIKIKPLLQGGTGSNSHSIFQPEIMPDSLESGTLNTPGIIGLKQGIEFINQHGLETIKHHKYTLIDRLHKGITELNNLKVYSKNCVNENSGIVAFNFNFLDSTEVGQILDQKYNIMCRTGFHCAPMAHKTLGTYDTGLIRLSVGCYNTMEEMDIILSALREISVSK